MEASRLDRITVQMVDEYRAAKKRQGKLATGSINRTIDTLAAVLDMAIEYAHIEKNVARGKRRKLATKEEAAGIPRRRRSDRRDPRRGS